MAQIQTKMCANGHVMDASWDRCLYCPRPVPPTRVGVPAPAPVQQPPPAQRAPAAAKQTQDWAAALALEKKTPIVGWLLVLSGKRKGEDFRIREGKNVVGSEPASDIVVDDPYVSARHATINSVVKDGERVYVLRDLDSRNGTFLNQSDEPIYHEEIIDSDTIRFGTTACKFKCV